MANPSQINRGGAQNQRQPREQTGSRGELNEGRPRAAEDVTTDPREAQSRRERMEKAEREMPRAFPDREPAQKKTGEF